MEVEIKYKYSIKINQEQCNGCQACVLACSYHHSQKFDITSNSSIKIFRDNKNGEISIDYERASCDMCPEEEIPLCMQFCAMDAIRFTRTKNKF